MPPERRARAHPAARPYTDGSGNMRAESDDDGAGAPPTTLPDDALFGIFSRVSGAADAARCAATCRLWGRVVAERAAAISRALPPPDRFAPHLALGFFHQDNDDVGARGGAQPRFVPTAAFASRFPGSAHLLDDGGALFDRSRPVASRNGRVVLELRRADDSLALSVWNPMTGEVSVLPPLSGPDFPGDYYACGILTGDDDLQEVVRPACFFRLLLVYNRRSFTALRSYSSDTGCWGPQGRMPGAKISRRVLRQLGPAVVLCGVAYWPMRDAALGVRLDDDGTPPSEADVCAVPYRLTHSEADQRVLGVSPDGRSLRYVGVAFVGRSLLSISFLTSQLQGVGYRSTTGGFGDDIHDQHIDVPQIKVTRDTKFKLRWFGEKSGILLFTVGEAAGSTGAVFALNVATRSLEKLAEGVGYHECRHLCGYEMDRAALLASVAFR